MARQHYGNGDDMSRLFAFRGRNPLARTDDLLTEEFGEELLVYDQRTDRAHCLSSAASSVWRACDGSTSAEQLGPALGLDAEVVARALEELEAAELLEGGAPGGVTRREATARLAKMGAAAAAAPLIYSIAAPIPEAAATVQVGACSNQTNPNTNPCSAPTPFFCRFSGVTNGTCNNGVNISGTGGYCLANCSSCSLTQFKATCGTPGSATPCASATCQPGNPTFSCQTCGA